MRNRKIAEYLLKIKAVQISVDKPYTWSSGWRSPIYCDNRMALSYPEIRTAIKMAFVEMIQEKYPHVDGIAGVATGAIAWGSLVAEEMGLPFVYIRAKAKGHGLQNLVEGKVEAGKSYVVIEDLVSTGKSSVAAVRALQEAKAEIMATLCIFSYGFPQADQAFAQTQSPYQPLTNLPTLLAKAIEIDYLEPREKETIISWQQNPESWGQQS